MTDTLPAAVVAMIRNNIRAVMLPVIACILTIPVWGADAAPERTAFGLSNEYIRAEFNRGGLSKLEDYRLGDAVEFGPNAFQIKVDGTTLSSETMSCEMITQMQHSVAYVYKQGTAALKVEYELQPGWRFISRQLFYGTRESEYRIEEVTVFSAMLQNSISEEQTLQGGKYGVLLRLNPAKANGPGWGMFMLLQNPFMQWKQDGQMLSASYEPDMTWKKEYGLFASDRCCIGLYQLSGTRYPLSLVPEWKYIAAGEQQEVKEQIDSAEVEALANCVRAFLLFDNKTSIKFHVGWCENDYQIDAGTAEGREEYKRIITRASQIGCENLLFGPSHSDIAPFNGNADAWGWEQVLWLGLGQKIRKGEWIPGKDPIPGSV